MSIKRVKLVYFSPTGTTKKVLEGIADAMQVDLVEQLDLTPPEVVTREFEELQDELAIIGAPVYAGRIPLDAVHRFRGLKANNTLVVVVVLYGNREYEDALLELNNLATEIGFKPVAAGAFIGEHSFSNDNMPIASGRPDAEDLKKARVFGKKIGEKIKGIKSYGDISPLQLPGNFPYKERRELSKIPPITDETLCTNCATCVTVCPTAAITINDMVVTDPKICILCCACVKSCPTQARFIDNPQVQKIVEWLSTNYRARKEPEMYL